MPIILAISFSNHLKYSTLLQCLQCNTGRAQSCADRKFLALDKWCVAAGPGNLVIQAVQKSDAGWFVCSAKNLAGTRETQPAELKIIGKLLAKNIGECQKFQFGKIFIDFHCLTLLKFCLSDPKIKITKNA